ncbi:uncharacterized protein TRIADDRAFT_19410 [Trichoplax adhaerens]|uniref:ubiquitinyl hydrolase 1 n=1 Tax=Trichoplax adhaerens TaxID=10228 RepID=B3RI19_TRIAD|nr:hypothetical protein TRIADDRAFT_19410 [Trichoplax adhaerens]EDV29689.1 hypothetical protein TRIADDRAFT_19410 [Trichoplax adhaerens]|eukprot:XP_002108891.1 hypothetical protein TRIADDRAFT_19410 [Trichoplax adhaerens]
MNSILQCLINSVPLTKYFLTSTYRTDLNRENPLGMHGEVAEEFATIVHASWCGEYRYISPTDFKLTMSKFADRFAGNSQHDSQELLMILLDGLHEDINRVKQKDYIEDDDTSHLPDEEAANIAWDRHKRRNQSIIVELFQGQFKSTLVCLTCNKRSVTFQVFMNLSVPLPSHRSHCTLNDCLELFSKAERVQGDNKWFCSKCKCYREAMKKLEIWKLPPVLLIHFKRFSGTGLYWQKADTAVNFPVNGLTLKNQTVGPKHRHYNLYAVSNHYGTLEGGHYTAFCQNPYAKEWYKFDDHIVSRISSNDVKTSSAYILFYTSLNIPPLKLKKFSS